MDSGSAAMSVMAMGISIRVLNPDAIILPGSWTHKITYWGIFIILTQSFAIAGMLTFFIFLLVYRIFL